MVSLKKAIRIPKSSKIVDTLEALNMIHPLEYVINAFNRIQQKLRILGFERVVPDVEQS